MHITEARLCRHCECIDDAARCCYCQFSRRMLEAGDAMTQGDAVSVIYPLTRQYSLDFSTRRRFASPDESNSLPKMG